MTKLSPEYWVSTYIKSATKREIKSKLDRRVLTLLFCICWFIGLIPVWNSFQDARQAEKDYARASIQLGLTPQYVGSLLSQYEIESRKESYKNEQLQRMETAKSRMQWLPDLLYYFLFAFVCPWIILRIIFWIVNAKEENVKP